MKWKLDCVVVYADAWRNTFLVFLKEYGVSPENYIGLIKNGKLEVYKKIPIYDADEKEE